MMASRSYVTLLVSRTDPLKRVTREDADAFEDMSTVYSSVPPSRTRSGDAKEKRTMELTVRDIVVVSLAA